MVESQLPKLLVAGSIPVSRSKIDQASIRGSTPHSNQGDLDNFRSDEFTIPQEALPVVLSSENQQQREPGNYD